MFTEHMPALSATLAVLGLSIALWGTWIAGDLPLRGIMRVAGSYGGASDEQISEIERQYKTGLRRSRALMVIGTALQIAAATIVVVA